MQASFWAIASEDDFICSNISDFMCLFFREF